MRESAAGVEVPSKAVIQDAGRQIPTDAANRYKLLVTPEFLANGELNKHRQIYGERFDLDTFDTVDSRTRNQLIPEQIITKILEEKVKGKEERTVVLISNEMPQEELERLTQANIRFILADTKELLSSQAARYGDDDTRKARELYQQSTYAVMSAVRLIKGEDLSDEKSSVYRTLTAYIENRLELQEGITVDDYIKAIVGKDVAKLRKARLKPIQPINVEEEHNTITKPLIFA